MKYKCVANLHLWDWENFKQAIDGKILDYCAENHICKWIIYEVDDVIDKEVIEKYNDIIIIPLED